MDQLPGNSGRLRAGKRNGLGIPGCVVADGEDILVPPLGTGKGPTKSMAIRWNGCDWRGMGTISVLTGRLCPVR